MEIKYSTLEDFKVAEDALNNDKQVRKNSFGFIGYKQLEIDSDKYWNPSFSFFVNGELAGVMSLSILSRNGIVNIDFLYVLPRFRGNGYGETLVWRAKNVAEEFGCTYLTLKVMSENAEGRNFYERLGFVSEGYENRFLFGKRNGTVDFMEFKI